MLLMNTSKTSRFFTNKKLFSHTKGYYRTNYAPDNWKAIIDSLHHNYTAIDKLTRATLIDDAFNLARNGYLNYSIVFELVNASRGRDADYLTWKSILYNLEELVEYAPESCIAQMRVSGICRMALITHTKSNKMYVFLDLHKRSDFANIQRTNRIR